MSQGLEVDLKEIVLSNSTFGPNEIEQLTRAISEDSSRLAVLRDSVGELEVSEEQTPATAVRLGVCYYLLGRYGAADRDACAMPTAVPWPVSTWAGRYSRAMRMRRRSRATTRRAAPATTATSVRWPSAEAQRYLGDAAGGAGHAGQPVRCGGADGRVPLPAWRDGGRAGRQSERGGGVCTSGPWRVDATSSRRPVRLGAGERPARRRRGGIAAVRAGGARVSRRTSARC